MATSSEGRVPDYESMCLGFEQAFTQSEGVPALYKSRRRNLEVLSYREEGPGHCSISIASQCPKNYL